MLLSKMRIASTLPPEFLMRIGSLFGLPIQIMRYEVVRLRKDATSSLR